VALIVKVIESDLQIYKDIDEKSGLTSVIVDSTELKNYGKQLREENDIIFVED
jgi:hypothetical protein